MTRPNGHSRLRDFMDLAGSDAHTGNNARVPIEVVEKLSPCALHLFVVIHGRAHGDSSIGSRKLAGGENAWDAIRLLHLDRSNDPCQARPIGLFCVRADELNTGSGKPLLEPLLPFSLPGFLGNRLGSTD